MKQKQSVATALIMLVTGLLIAVSVPFINSYIKIPDFLSGTLAGFGIGIELIAVIKLIKLKQLKKAKVPY